MPTPATSLTVLPCSLLSPVNRICHASQTASVGNAPQNHNDSRGASSGVLNINAPDP